MGLPIQTLLRIRPTGWRRSVHYKKQHSATPHFANDDNKKTLTPTWSCYHASRQSSSGLTNVADGDDCLTYCSEWHPFLSPTKHLQINRVVKSFNLVLTLWNSAQQKYCFLGFYEKGAGLQGWGFRARLKDRGYSEACPRRAPPACRVSSKVSEMALENWKNGENIAKSRLRIAEITDLRTKIVKSTNSRKWALLAIVLCPQKTRSCKQHRFKRRNFTPCVP